jgi:hypothetical protein
MSVTVWSNNPELAGARYPGAFISEDNPPKDNSYDIVLLDHLINQAKRGQVGEMLRFFMDKLVDSGQIVVTVPSLEWASKQIAAKDDAPIMAYLSVFGTDEEPHLCGLTLNWLRLACEAAGYFTFQAYSESYNVTINDKKEAAMQNVYIGLKMKMPE